MKMKTSFSHVVDILAILLLILLFSSSALAVVLLGANVYEKSTANMNRNFTTRTALSYVTEMIRQNDLAGGIRAEKEDGTDALVLDRTYDDELYRTFIYSSGNELMELTQKASDPFRADAGRRIMEISAFSVSEEADGIFRFTVTGTDGKTESISVAERSAA